MPKCANKIGNFLRLRTEWSKSSLIEMDTPNRK